MLRLMVLAAAVVAGPAASAAPDAVAAPGRPARVILVGDSTMAPQTGYGDALCSRMTTPVQCLNLAYGGRSSMSYRAEGLWADVQQRLLDGSAYRVTYVLIQFGHNDQPGKPGRSTDLATEFPRNIAGYVREVKALGGIPVLLTPLTRRSFKGSRLQNDLRPWAEAAILVATEQQVPLIDLNAASAAAVQAMGEAEADTLATAPPPGPGEPSVAAAQAAAAAASRPYRGFDRTHLGAKGAARFAQMVEQGLRQTLPETAALFKSAP